MERRKITRKDGAVTLLGYGPSGAVSLDAWEYQGEAHGVLGIHLATWHSHLGEIASACEYLEEGACYPDQTWRHALEPAQHVIAGDEESGWAAVEEWYRSRIEGAIE